MSRSRWSSRPLLLSTSLLCHLACGGAATDGELAPETRALSLDEKPGRPFPDFAECQGLEPTRRAVCRAVLGRMTLEGAALSIPAATSLFSSDQALNVSVATGHSCTATARLLRRRSSITVSQEQALRLLGGFERRAASIEVDLPVEVTVTIDAEERTGVRILGSCIELSRRNTSLVGRLSTSVQASVPYNLRATFAEDVTGDVTVSLQPTITALGQLLAATVSPRVSGSATSGAALEAAALSASADTFASANPEISRRLREVINGQVPALLGLDAEGKRSYLLHRGFEERMATLGTSADLYRELRATPAGAAHVAEILAAPASLAPDGVAFLRLDELVPEELEAVVIGDTELLLAPPSVAAAATGSVRPLARASTFGLVELPPNDERLRNVLGVRLPPDQPLGQSQITIRSRSGSSQSVPVDIVASGLFAPNPPDRIFIPISNAAHDDAFPVATDGAFDVVPNLPDDQQQWQYVLNLRSLCSGRAELIGAVEGFEIFYADERGHDHPPLCPPEAAACSPLRGRFSLDSTSNYMVLDVERADGTERYRGAWATRTGEPVNTFNGFLEDADLILTSERTGRQILIDHRISETCR